MNAPDLKVVAMSYPRSRETAWKASCDMLGKSGACDYLKKFLAAKAQRRSGTRRFFGEAYVSTQIEHVAGYYGSFQWLSNPRFLATQPFPPGPSSAFQQEYRAALQRHFAADLKRAQRNASMLEAATRVRPVVPDLWLLEPSGRHRFIEVKLPEDTVSEGQLAGLAVIANSFGGVDLSVEIVELNPDREGEFREFSRLLKSAG